MACLNVRYEVLGTYSTLTAPLHLLRFSSTTTTSSLSSSSEEESVVVRASRRSRGRSTGLRGKKERHRGRSRERRSVSPSRRRSRSLSIEERIELSKVEPKRCSSPTQHRKNIVAYYAVERTTNSERTIVLRSRQQQQEEDKEIILMPWTRNIFQDERVRVTQIHDTAITDATSISITFQQQNQNHIPISTIKRQCIDKIVSSSNGILAIRYMSRVVVLYVESSTKSIFSRITLQTKFTFKSSRNNKSKQQQHVSGMQDAISRLEQLIRISLLYPRNSSKIISSSLRPKGVLLRGMRGCGKTTMWKTVSRRLHDVHTTSFDPIDVVRDNIKSPVFSTKSTNLQLVILENIDLVIQCGDLEKLLESIRRLVSPRTCILLTASDENVPSRTLRRLVQYLGEQEMIVPSLTEQDREQILISYLGDIFVSSSSSSSSSSKTTTTSQNIKEIASRMARATNGYIANDLVTLCRDFATRLDMSSSSSSSSSSTSSLALESLRQVRPSQLTSLTLRVPTERWNHIGGYDDVKQRLTQLVKWRWTRPDALKRLGVRPARGVLLHGPSGCGKGLLAHALAGECGVNFVLVRGTELFSKYLGESEEKLRFVFARARAAAPCLLFFDEIDSIAAGRDLSGGGGGKSSQSGVSERMLSTLLNEMDGVGTKSTERSGDADGDDDGVVVLAATNRVDMIDAAILRPGRIDRMIEVCFPGVIEREDILRVCTKDMPLGKNVSLKRLAERSEGKSGAFLSEWCRRAGMEALRRGDKEINMTHFG